MAIVLVLMISWMTPALAQEKGWMAEWNQVLAQARKEGKVVVRGFLGSDQYQPTAKFTARFGVPVEYATGRSTDVSARLRTERRAAVYNVDVFLGGIGSLAQMHLEKMLDPIRPQLVLPEVVDPHRWKRGKLWFADPEEKYILRLFNYLTGLFYINTKHVRLEELKSVKDLLHPRWKGKISADDPTVSGSGALTAAQFYLELGEEFVRKLYIDQQPIFSRTTRQLADWLIRGTYPIALNINSRDRERLKEEGFPIVTVYSLPDAPGGVSASSGMVVLLNKAPHPNAARLFINWLASKEGLEAYSRAQLIATTRNDVDESFLPREQIPQAGVDYFDSYEWNFTVTGREKIRLRMKELLSKKS